MKKFKKFTALTSSIVLLASMAAMNVGAASAETYKLGDINQDGVIDCRDLVALKKGMSYLTPLTETQKKIADINSDGHVNLTDLSLLKLHCAGLKTISGEVTVYYDENGNVVSLLNDNANLAVTSNGWLANISNEETRSSIELTGHYLSQKNADGSASTFISPWSSEVRYSSDNADAVLNLCSGYTALKTNYNTGTELSTGVSAWGNISISHDGFDESIPFMRNSANYFKNTSVDDALFAASDYAVDETVSLVNAEVIKRENGIEFSNHVSDDTVNAFMADDFVTIDDVKITYAEGEFTVEGIADENIELLHTMTVGQYDEIAVMTNTPGNRLIYGLMYDTASQSMAALVKVRVDKNMEATVIQYSKPADMATTINFYPKDYVFDEAMANPDNMVTMFDNDYNPDNLVFQTVAFTRKTKNALIGSLNARYQITNGFTFKQTGSANSVKSTYETTATTLSFSNAESGLNLTSVQDGYTIGIDISDDTVKYINGGESLALAGGYTPDTSITYEYGETSEVFTPVQVLSQRGTVLY